MLGFPGGSVGKESACKAGDPGSIPGLGRSAGEGIGYPLQYSSASSMAQLVKNPPAMWETWGSIPGLGRSPGEGKGYPLRYSVPEHFRDCIDHWVMKSWTLLSWNLSELDTLSLSWGFPGGSDSKKSICNVGEPGLIPGSGRSPKEMATHSSIFAWEIPWIGEPGRLQFMGSQKSLRKLSKQTTATFYNLKRIYHFASPILKDKV